MHVITRSHSSAYYSGGQPIRNIFEDTGQPLQPLRFGWRNESIVCIKIHCKVVYRRAESVHARLCHCYYHQPVVDDGVHCNIEVHIICIALRPTPYTEMISRHLYQSSTSYRLCRSIDFLWRPASLIDVICYSSLASGEEIPVPWPNQNPWIISCKQITEVKRRFWRPVLVFNR